MDTVVVYLDNSLTEEDIKYSGFNHEDYDGLRRVGLRGYHTFMGDLTDETIDKLIAFVRACPIGHLFDIYRGEEYLW